MLPIVIDTREQRPWTFPEWVSTEIGTVRTGDYCLKGDSSFSVERKSLDDFIGTVFSDWKRFQREILRMEEWKFVAKIVIVESSFADFCFSADSAAIIPPLHNHPQITPQALMAKVAELSMMGVTVLFCNSPQLAAAMAYALFVQRNRQLNEQNNNGNN